MQHNAGGDVPAVGRRTRTIAPALRRALLHRDRGCRFLARGLADRVYVIDQGWIV